ncbi:MAG: MoaD/ThiS family protein [Dehalococcoidia bacterium]
MAVVWIPSLLRPLAGGASTLRIPGATIRDVIDELDRRHPGFRDRLVEDGELRPQVAISVDSQVATELDTAIGDDAELHIIPAMSGG